MQNVNKMRFHGKSLVISFSGCNFGCIKQYTRRYEYQTEHHLHVGEQEEGRSSYHRERAYSYAR